MKEYHLIEVALENMEACLDNLTDNELLKSIPIVGTAVKLFKGAPDIEILGIERLQLSCRSS